MRQANFQQHWVQPYPLPQLSHHTSSPCSRLNPSKFCTNVKSIWDASLCSLNWNRFWQKLEPSAVCYYSQLTICTLYLGRVKGRLQAIQAIICDILFFTYVLPRYLENIELTAISLLILSILCWPYAHFGWSQRSASSYDQTNPFLFSDPQPWMESNPYIKTRNWHSQDFGFFMTFFTFFYLHWHSILSVSVSQ